MHNAVNYVYYELIIVVLEENQYVTVNNYNTHIKFPQWPLISCIQNGYQLLWITNCICKPKSHLSYVYVLATFVYV